MLLQCPLRGHHGRLDPVFRLEVQTLASVPVLRTLALHLDAALRHLVEVLHRQVLVHLALVLLVEVLRRQVLVHLAVVLLVVVLTRQVLVPLVEIAPCPGLQQMGCFQVEPSGAVFPCPGSKKMDCCRVEVCQALLRRRISPPRLALRLPAQKPVLARLPRGQQAQ